MKRFAGVFTPIVTPFDRSDQLDEAGLRGNVARWMATRLTGLIALGSNGEAVQLDEEESDRVIAIVRELVPLIAGTGRESTKATIDASRRAAALGVDAVLVRTPSFFKAQMTTDEFVRHYTEVADRSPVPVLLYNVTAYTGVNLSPQAVERLAQHPNIAGMKESGSDIGHIAELVARTPGDFTVLAGSATTYFHALCAGCDGAVLALAAIVPEMCVQMRELVAGRDAGSNVPGGSATRNPPYVPDEPEARYPYEGADCRLFSHVPPEQDVYARLNEARELQRRLMPLARSVGGQYGVPGLKAALDLMGFAAGPPRLPLLHVPPEVVEIIRAQLEELGVRPVSAAAGSR
jgi:4-hydroxy-2-oxoglutarate aldolase